MIEVKDGEFEQQVLNSEIPVIVDFWAPWCGPCKMIAPILDTLSVEYDGQVKFVKINVDECPETAKTFGVRGIPTLMTFKEGSFIETATGSRPKGQIEALIKKVIA